ncbi:GGDEF domain-containing protein [Aliikangiella sp. G2MR2-5]|uniref:GGDEF domain-containing protein n=1 Tax=Aliikangiella sp. G2MR2-5 TaxID=2788943 RepID=UPI0018AC6D60|nr:GGDEF domain-containing protein [Aliikangiella sp. G2MR2-5]
MREFEASLERRIDMDILYRSLPGVYIYAFIWPAIFIPTGFYQVSPLICWGVAAAQLFLSVARLVQARFTKVWYHGSESRWFYILATLSLFQAALWGMLFWFALVLPEFETIQNMVTMAIIGMSSGAMISLSPKIKFASLNVLFLILPGFMASIFVNSDIAMTIIIAVYGFYLLRLGLRSHEEYIRAFRIEFQLESQKREAEHLNKIDPLTMIYNRGHFNASFELIWNNCIRARTPVSLLLIDVDHFKQVNDKHGHLFGDECLVYIANTISNSAKRATDLIARYGGEEFAVLLNDTELDEASILAEQIRLEVERGEFVYDGRQLKVTVSVGVACCHPKNGSHPNDLIEAADESLYRAKSSGRNCIVTNNSD